jgi:hypothetical protein
VKKEKEKPRENIKFSSEVKKKKRKENYKSTIRKTTTNPFVGINDIIGLPSSLGTGNRFPTSVAKAKFGDQSIK